MGWGLGKKEREELLGPDAPVNKNSAPKGRTEIIDMNAAARLYARPGLTIEQVANMLVRAAAPATVKRVFAVFDRPAKMPLMRSSLHRTRYAHTKMLSASEVQRVKRTHSAGKVHRPARQQPVDFNILFSPGPTKTLAWQLFAEAVWHQLVVHQSHGQHAEMYYPNGASAVVGHNQQPGTYSTEIEPTGEADLSVFEIAVRESAAGNPVTIRSVDTDLILQTVAYGMVGNQPFSPKWPFMLRLSKGLTISGIELCKRFGGDDPSDRLSAAFWMILAGGTDYSKPGSDQGYYKKELANVALTQSKVFTVTTARQVFLNIARLHAVLSGMRRRKSNVRDEPSMDMATMQLAAKQCAKGKGSAARGKQKAPPAKPVTPKAPPRSLKCAIHEAARSACYYGGYCATGVINAEWEMSDPIAQLA
jgi:hypothetical protein